MARYKIETIRNYMGRMNEAIRDYRGMIKAGQGVTVSISGGNKKIGRVMNVSLAPIVTCANCVQCQKLCYDIKANLQYKNVITARAKNTALALYSPADYFGQIREALKRRHSNKYFRWHVGGDIPNYSYFNEMVNIAREYPNFRFWTYTKNYAVVNAWCDDHGGKAAVPANLSIMFSEWRGMPMNNPYHFGEFSVVFNDDPVKPVGHYCPGNCDICKAAGRGCLVNETTYCKEH